ncbi:uncharacterized protein [Henckelia pumila]|uniref:uncharacterized protein n=1 Tax=Henckelia pumila TaxID=405737 RepID=UPI003C6DF056
MNVCTLQSGESSRVCGYKRKSKNRERVAGARRLFKDYFADCPVYSEHDFRRRFRDAVDEYLRIGASIALECLKTFYRGMHEIFSEQYLRQPTSEDVARLNAENARRGFPGMLGSIDCMH